MPQVGWTYRGTNYSFDEALKIATEKGHFARFPPAALRVMLNKDRNPFVFSPSSAAYCLRQRILRTQHDYYLDPDNVWKMSRGTAIHNYLDEEIPGRSEMHLSTTLEFTNSDGEIFDIDFAGTCDYYDAETQTLYDYKTTKTFYSFVKGEGKREKAYPTPEHELQTNLYAMLLRRHGMPVKRIFIWYVSAGDGRKLVPVPVWGEDEAEEVAYNMASHMIAPKTQGTLPPAIQPEDDEYWQCRFCPVAKICREKESNGE